MCTGRYIFPVEVDEVDSDVADVVLTAVASNARVVTSGSSGATRSVSLTIASGLGSGESYILHHAECPRLPRAEPLANLRFKMEDFIALGFIGASILQIWSTLGLVYYNLNSFDRGNCEVPEYQTKTPVRSQSSWFRNAPTLF